MSKTTNRSTKPRPRRVLGELKIGIAADVFEERAHADGPTGLYDGCHVCPRCRLTAALRPLSRVRLATMLREHADDLRAGRARGEAITDMEYSLLQGLLGLCVPCAETLIGDRQPDQRAS